MVRVVRTPEVARQLFTSAELIGWSGADFGCCHAAGPSRAQSKKKRRKAASSTPSFRTTSKTQMVTLTAPSAKIVVR